MSRTESSGLSAGELASALGYRLSGDASLQITGIAYAEEASADDLAVAFHPKEVRHTRAAVVLTAPHLLPLEKTYLFSHEVIELALIRAANLLAERGVCPDYGAPPAVSARGTYFIGRDVRLGEGVSIGPGAVICPGVVLGSGCVVGANAYIGSGVHLEEGVRVGPGSRVGVDSFFHAVTDGVPVPFSGVGRVLAGRGVVIGSNSTVQRGTISDTVIGSRTQIGDLVEIGHDVKIGANCKIVSQTGIAGNAVIGDYVWIYGQSGVANRVHIGDHAVIKAQSAVTKHVRPGAVIYGPFGREAGQELRLQARLNRFEKGKEG